MRWLLLVVPSLLAIALGACSTVRKSEELVLGPALERDNWDMPSQVYQDLVSLPKPKGKIVASVYSFRDLTGQYKPSPSSNFSTAVSQGAASMLVKAVRDSGWFAPLEREGLQDLLTERKIIRAAMKNQQANQDLPPLLGANVVLEGGIIGYETNMKTGGAGAKYFGIGTSEQYRVDQVSVNLRVVDVNTGRVINSVTTSKSILSKSMQGGIFRFVRFKRLLEVEAGYTRNEPVQLCLLEAIQAAVMRIIVEGIEDRSWTLAKPAEVNHPLMFKYGRRLPPPLPVKKENTKTDSQKQSDTKLTEPRPIGARAAKGIKPHKNSAADKKGDEPEEFEEPTTDATTAPIINDVEAPSSKPITAKQDKEEPVDSPSKHNELTATADSSPPTKVETTEPVPQAQTPGARPPEGSPKKKMEKVQEQANSAPASSPPPNSSPEIAPVIAEQQAKPEPPPQQQKNPQKKANSKAFTQSPAPNADPSEMSENEIYTGNDQSDTLATPEENFGREYTVQLISSSSSTEVLKFAEKNNLSRGMIKYIHYEVEGSDRFAILYGRYATKKLALRALENLPARVKVFDPWVRAYDNF